MGSPLSASRPSVIAPWFRCAQAVRDSPSPIATGDAAPSEAEQSQCPATPGAVRTVTHLLRTHTRGVCFPPPGLWGPKQSSAVREGARPRPLGVMLQPLLSCWLPAPSLPPTPPRGPGGALQRSGSRGNFRQLLDAAQVCLPCATHHLKFYFPEWGVHSSLARLSHTCRCKLGQPRSALPSPGSFSFSIIFSSV